MGIGQGAVGVLLAGVLVMGTGCETKSFIDPSELGRYKKDPLVLPILDRLDTGIEEPTEEFADAGEIRPDDLVADASDYVIGRNDLINVSITDLVGPGVETLKTTRVAESGKISLPLIGQLQAAGRTEADLEQDIIAAYRDAGLIQNAQVSVTVVEARQRKFSVLGSGRNGQYALVESDFRILDAMVLMGELGPYTDYVYVIRQERDATTTQPAADDAAAPADEGGPLLPDEDPLAPQPAPSTEPAAGDDLTPEGEGPMAIVDGQPVAVDPAATLPEEVAATSPSGEEFEFGYLAEPKGKRVIRVPVQPLMRGELKYNIVIRPNDLIMIPPPVTGEYYLGGHVARGGVYSLTGRKISLKQAIISGGGLDGVAIPERTDIIRRIGPNKEVWARVDLNAIFDGRQPDIWLKPNDQIMVGTNALAPFIAAVRNGFRFSYGTGLFYDANFWDDDDNN
jgi:polysaccharide export outer membrane protein